MEKINARIHQEICHKTLEELTDVKLIGEYMEYYSVKNQIRILGYIVEKYTDEKTKQAIIQEYLLHLIPAGTKWVIM
jgi:hypothetical protein